MKNRKCSILLVCLLFVLFLSLSVGFYTYALILKSRISYLISDSLRVETAIETAIKKYISYLSSMDSQKIDYSRLSRTYDIDSVGVYVTARDIHSYINVNALEEEDSFTREALERFLEYFLEEDSEIVIEGIKRQMRFGAEGDAASSQQLPVLSKRLLEVIEDIFHVKEIASSQSKIKNLEKENYESFKEAALDNLTVWGDGKVNVNSLSPFLLSLLLQNKGDVDRIIARRKIKNIVSKTELPIDETLNIAKGFFENLCFSSKLFKIVGVSKQFGMERKIEELVEIKGEDKFRILAVRIVR